MPGLGEAAVVSAAVLVKAVTTSTNKKMPFDGGVSSHLPLERFVKNVGILYSICHTFFFRC